MQLFEIQKIKGKKTIILPLDKFKDAINHENQESKLQQISGLRVKVINHGYEILNGEKGELAFKLAKRIDLNPIDEKKWDRKLNIQ